MSEIKNEFQEQLSSQENEPPAARSDGGGTSPEHLEKILGII
ncbi:MAG: hypothetical protein ABIH71_05445 [Candidatus Omnitrophota bacterium]